MLLISSSRAVLAVIVTKPEISVPLLVMNCLEPLIIQWSSVERRRRPRVAGVRAGLGLGQPERAQRLPGAQPRHPLALLLLGAEGVERPGAEADVGGHRDGHAGVDARELLDHERVAQVVGAAPAVLLGVGDPHQPELAELLDDRVGKALGAVELLGHRLDLARGEVAREVADGLLLVAEVEVHRARMLAAAAPGLSESASCATGRAGSWSPARARRGCEEPRAVPGSEGVAAQQRDVVARRRARCPCPR